MKDILRNHGKDGKRKYLFVFTYIYSVVSCPDLLNLVYVQI